MINDKKINCYLNMAKEQANLSKDEQTKVGAVLLSKNGHIIGTGYNGFIKGAPDVYLPKTRPDKYQYMIHAEVNALLSCSVAGGERDGALLFCTLSPCQHCMRILFQAGIRKFYVRELYKDFSTTCADMQIDCDRHKDYFEITVGVKNEISDSGLGINYIF